MLRYQMKSDILIPMDKRTQIQIDCSPDLRQKIRVLALQEGITLRTAVLKALADRYPSIKLDVTAELKRQK